MNKPLFAKFREANSNALPDVPDRESFFFALDRRTILDQLSVADAYLDNQKKSVNGTYKTTSDESGTQSANGSRKTPLNGKSDISFLDVAPGQPLLDEPPVTFMDPMSALDGSDVDAPSQLLRRMFWRAHPEDTCEVEGLVNTLRDQCIAGASLPGGDPEACTRCVEVAELQMPTCALWGTNSGFIPSKCSALGYKNSGGIDASYYAPVVSGEQPSCLDHKTALVPPYFAAFHYCTGTQPYSVSSSGQADWAQLSGIQPLSEEVLQTFECAEFPDWFAEFGPFDHEGILSHQEIGRSSARFAYGVGENIPHGNSWLPPIVSAQTFESENHIIDQHNWCMQQNPNFRNRITRSNDDRLASLTYPLPIWDNETGGLRAFAGDDRNPDVHPIDVEYCGIIQRATYANRDCLELLPMLGISLTADADELRKAGYAASTAVGNGETRCSVLEPRRLKSTCFEGTCSANGLCTAHDPPDFLYTP